MTMTSNELEEDYGRLLPEMVKEAYYQIAKPYYNKKGINEEYHDIEMDTRLEVLHGWPCPGYPYILAEFNNVIKKVDVIDKDLEKVEWTENLNHKRLNLLTEFARFVKEFVCDMRIHTDVLLWVNKGLNNLPIQQVKESLASVAKISENWVNDLDSMSLILNHLPHQDYMFGKFFHNGREGHPFRFLEIYNNFRSFYEPLEAVSKIFQENQISFDSDEKIIELMNSTNLFCTDHYSPLKIFRQLTKQIYEFYDQIVVWVEKIFAETRVFHPDYLWMKKLDKYVHDIHGVTKYKRIELEILNQLRSQTECSFQGELTDITHVYRIHMAYLDPDLTLIETIVCVTEEQLFFCFEHHRTMQIKMIDTLPLWASSLITHDGFGTRLIVMKLALNRKQDEDFLFNKKYQRILNDTQVLNSDIFQKHQHFIELSYKMYDTCEQRDLVDKNSSQHNEQVIALENLATFNQGIFLLFNSEYEKSIFANHLDKCTHQSFETRAPVLLDKLQLETDKIVKIDRMSDEQLCQNDTLAYYRNMVEYEEVMRHLKISLASQATQYKLRKLVFGHPIECDLDSDREMLTSSDPLDIFKIQFKNKKLKFKLQKGFLLHYTDGFYLLSIKSKPNHLTILRCEYMFPAIDDPLAVHCSELTFPKQHFEKYTNINLKMLGLDDNFFYGELLKEIRKDHQNTAYSFVGEIAFINYKNYQMRQVENKIEIICLFENRNDLHKLKHCVEIYKSNALNGLEFKKFSRDIEEYARDNQRQETHTNLILFNYEKNCFEFNPGLKIEGIDSIQSEIVFERTPLYFTTCTLYDSTKKRKMPGLLILVETHVLFIEKIGLLDHYKFRFKWSLINLDQVYPSAARLLKSFKSPDEATKYDSCCQFLYMHETIGYDVNQLLMQSDTEFVCSFKLAEGKFNFKTRKIEVNTKKIQERFSFLLTDFEGYDFFNKFVNKLNGRVCKKIDKNLHGYYTIDMFKKDLTHVVNGPYLACFIAESQQRVRNKNPELIPRREVFKSSPESAKTKYKNLNFSEYVSAKRSINELNLTIDFEQEIKRWLDEAPEDYKDKKIVSSSEDEDTAMTSTVTMDTSDTIDIEAQINRWPCGPEISWVFRVDKFYWMVLVQVVLLLVAIFVLIFLLVN